MTDKTMYKIIIKGIPTNLKMINNASASARKMYRTLLSAQEKFLNLRAKREIGKIRDIEEISAKEIKK